MTGFEQRNNAFSRAMTDVQIAYIDAERKVMELEKENENLRGKLQALRAHGIEVVDAIADGVEIYSEEHAELDRLKAENKELRKTCLDMYSALLKLGYMPCLDNVDFFPTLRELGILTCFNCDKCEAHGYQPYGMERTVFTVSLWCSDKGASTGPYDSCDEHIIGEPCIIRDDMDVS